MCWVTPARSERPSASWGTGVPFQCLCLELGGYWDGNTTWGMPRHRWSHRSWGTAVLVTRLVGPGSCHPERWWGRFFHQINGLTATSLFPPNKWIDSNINMKSSSSIRYTTMGENFIEEWTMEIFDYLTVVEPCIPVNRLGAYILLILLLFLQKSVCFIKNVVISLMWHYDNCCRIQRTKWHILDIFKKKWVSECIM